MKIALGVTGSIAAYRSPDLVKELVKRGHEVRVVLTRAAKELVSARVLSTFAGAPVLSEDVFAEDHSSTDHIEMARWADCFVVYGATADFMAKYAHGLAGDFLSLQLVATRSPVYLAPAMNPAMWEHASVQENFRILKSRGVHFVGPIHGVVACGEEGLGHIASLTEISDAIQGGATGSLKGKRILISAGPMRTTIDSVRYVQNRSSGLMGLALAQAAKARGAEVKVLLGPVESGMAASFLELGGEFGLTRFTGPEEYARGLEALFPQSDIFLSLAAVLDFELEGSSGKIERETLSKQKELKVPLKTVPDFVALMASKRKAHQKVVAFAAESGKDEEILKRAWQKMKKKNVDAIVANPVREGLGPEASDNELWVFSEAHSVDEKSAEHLGPAAKTALAGPLLDLLFK
jgi:phosphopantothenoylcysteine decarboxylase/phosphopantothenate--cysteine ligase